MARPAAGDDREPVLTGLERGRDFGLGSRRRTGTAAAGKNRRSHDFLSGWRYLIHSAARRTAAHRRTDDLAASVVGPCRRAVPRGCATAFRVDLAEDPFATLAGKERPVDTTGLQLLATQGAGRIPDDD